MNIVKYDNHAIKQAVAILKRNGVIIYPTDTAYGLGGFFNSRKVVNKILKIKGRKDEKFTLVAADLKQVNRYFELNKLQLKLAKKYWPGPLSLVVSKKFAIRVPKSRIARLLARRAGRPLIATSANISGQQTLYDSREVVKEFSGKANQPDAIIDSGRLKIIKTSTIVAVKNNKVEILRPGAVKIN